MYIYIYLSVFLPPPSLYMTEPHSYSCRGASRSNKEGKFKKKVRSLKWRQSLPSVHCLRYITLLIFFFLLFRLKS